MFISEPPPSHPPVRTVTGSCSFPSASSHPASCCFFLSPEASCQAMWTLMEKHCVFCWNQLSQLHKSSAVSKTQCCDSSSGTPSPGLLPICHQQVQDPVLPTETILWPLLSSSGSSLGFKYKENQGHNLLEPLLPPDHTGSASGSIYTPFTPMNEKAFSV